LTLHKILAALSLCFAVARAPVARAAEDEPAVGSEPAADNEATAESGQPAPAPEPPQKPELSFLETYYPPPVDGPELRLPESPTRLYLDGAYAASNDLSALPYIVGSGKNFRFSLGGVLRWHRFSFDAEIPFAQVTTLDVTMVPGGTPVP
jgi:hypothetical protein